MDTIHHLVELQKIDLELMELTDLLGDLPEKVNQLVSEEKTLLEEIENGKARLKDISVELHKADVDVQEATEKIDKLKDQLFLVTSNKQYDALMQEIDFLKEELNRFETVDLELMEEKSELEELVKSKEQTHETLSEDLGTRKEKLEKLISETSNQKNALEEKRNEKAGMIDPNAVKRYDRVRSAKGGVAVVAVDNNACGGCGAGLPPQDVADIKTGSGVHHCYVCTRFLYWEKS